MPSWFTSVLLSVVILGDDDARVQKRSGRSSREVSRDTGMSFRMLRCTQRRIVVANSFEFWDADWRIYSMYYTLSQLNTKCACIREISVCGMTRSKSRYVIEQSAHIPVVSRKYTLRVPTTKNVSNFLRAMLERNDVTWRIRLSIGSNETCVRAHMQKHTRTQSMHCCTGM